MQVTASGYVYDARTGQDHQKSCAFTTVTCLRDGTLLVTFRRGSDRDSLDGHECILASSDWGSTWKVRYDGFGEGAWADGTPGEVKGLTIAETAPGELLATGLWVDRSNPDLPFINPETQGLLPMRIFHTTSMDGGRTWGVRHWMDTSPHVAASPTSAAVLRLSDNESLLDDTSLSDDVPSSDETPRLGGILAQPYEHWKAYDDPAPGQPGAYLRLSYDNGKTWPAYVPVAKHSANGLYFWDQRLAIHPETGQLVAMFWTHNPNIKLDQDVHIAWGTPDGRSWSEPGGTGLPGQHCQPISMGGDQLIAVYTRRLDPPGIVATLSSDFGQTWDHLQEVVVYDSREGTEAGAEGPREQAELWSDMEAWRFGHPRGVRLPTGEVFVVFYAGDDKVKSVHWARLQL